MVVFDFDKTLINKDTLFGFYKSVHGNGILFKLKHVILIIFAILYKLKLINNDKLKSVGIALFLKGKTKEQLEIASTKYAKTLTLNKLYNDVFLNTPQKKRIIISASPEVYLKKVFPNEEVLGTLLDFKNNKVSKLKMNCYGNNKITRLNEKSPNSIIDLVYSDSMSDKPLFEKSKKHYLVKNGSLTKNQS